MTPQLHTYVEDIYSLVNGPLPPWRTNLTNFTVPKNYRNLLKLVITINTPIPIYLRSYD